MKTVTSCLPAAVLMLSLLAGCSPKHLVILVPDPDLKVGKAEVTTAGGTQLLEKPGDMTTVSSGSSPPSPVIQADPAFIAATFADALAIEPLPSATFILYFPTGSTDLTPESASRIADILDAVLRRPAISVRISGHCDAVGSYQLNDRLARDRAWAIRNLLVQKGVNPDIITVTSHGKGNPLVPTVDGVAEPRNRRVEVIVR